MIPWIRTAIRGELKVKRYGQHLSVADPAKFAATLANASGTQKVF